MATGPVIRALEESVGSLYLMVALHLPSTEVDIEISLENFISEQCDAKLRRGSEDSSWKVEKSFGNLTFTI